MKKVLLFVLSVLMMVHVSVLAETTELGAAVDTDCYNVYIAGKTDLVEQSVSILLIEDDGNIGYVEQLTTDEKGAYELKFKFDGNISNYDVLVRETETAQNITSTLKTAFAKHELYSLDVAISNTSNDVTRYISENDALDVIVKINNKYGDSANVKVIFAAYDGNDKLLAIKTKDLHIGYNAINESKTLDFSDITLPDRTKIVKAFVWQDTVNLLPLAEEDVKENRGSVAFKNENPSEIKVIGLVGDSITHGGYYAEFLNQYYATKYPESNIVILNKGIGGDYASGINARLGWNIFNENDPIGLGACDEITVMIGMNDVGYKSFDKGPQDDYAAAYPEKIQTIKSCVDNIEKIAQYCKQNDIPITLITPSLYDESDRFVNSLDATGTRFGTNWALGEVAKAVLEFGKIYDIPVLDLYKATNEYSQRIRENYSNATTVITGTDGIHPQATGGFLLGYLFARAQETNEVVANVEIDANNSAVKATNASVTNLVADSNRVSYTYKAKSLPLYNDSRYRYVKNYGVDIENHMNKEMIKVTGLEDAEYTIKFDNVELGTYSASALASGINIATLANNPGQIKAGRISSIVSKKLSAEKELQSIAQTEKSIRGATKSSYYPTEMGTDFDNFTNEDWINCAKAIRKKYEEKTPESQWSDHAPYYGIMQYISSRKLNHDKYASEVNDYIHQLLELSKTFNYEVVISK